MSIGEILSNKTLKPKGKVEALCQNIINKKLSINDLMLYAETAKDNEKGTCIEALEFASEINAKIINKKCFDFVVNYLADKAPRVKWECAKIIGNTARLFKNDLDNAINNLLENTNYEGIVVRWSVAFALVEILKLKTEYNKKLLPKIAKVCEKETKPNIKKMYLDALENFGSL